MKAKPMLFHVAMTVNIPRDLPVEEADAIKAKEKAYSQDLQRQGKWPHIWRVAGRWRAWTSCMHCFPACRSSPSWTSR